MAWRRSGQPGFTSDIPPRNNETEPDATSTFFNGTISIKVSPSLSHLSFEGTSDAYLHDFCHVTESGVQIEYSFSTESGLPQPPSPHVSIGVQIEYSFITESLNFLLRQCFNRNCCVDDSKSPPG